MIFCRNIACLVQAAGGHQVGYQVVVPARPRARHTCGKNNHACSFKNSPFVQYPAAPASIPRLTHISGMANESCEKPCRTTAANVNSAAAPSQRAAGDGFHRILKASASKAREKAMKNTKPIKPVSASKRT